jgi:uncharacterized protein (TIGR00730 family)
MTMRLSWWKILTRSAAQKARGEVDGESATTRRVLRRVCVYAGSRIGADSVYARAAGVLAGALARRGLGLVYGGARVGLMGALADAAVSAGVEVIGVLPMALAHAELAHPGLHELRIVRDMHERKTMMAELGDGFVALPGGFGTLEEILEMVTWTELGLQRKPVGMLDVAGYWQRLAAQLDWAVGQGFIRGAGRAQLLRSEDPDELLDQLHDWRAPAPDPRVAAAMSEINHLPVPQPPPIDPRVSIPPQALAAVPDRAAEDR